MFQVRNKKTYHKTVRPRKPLLLNTDTEEKKEKALEILSKIEMMEKSVIVEPVSVQAETIEPAVIEPENITPTVIVENENETPVVEKEETVEPKPKRKKKKTTTAKEETVEETKE